MSPVNVSTKLHYRWYPSETQAGPTLLCLHGFMGSSRDFGFLSKAIPDCRILAVDLPGHGESKIEDPEDFSMGRCGALIIDLLDELEIERCSLHGYSMGGRLALYLAVFFSDRFDRIILESASPGLKTPEERQARIEHDRSLANRIRTEPMDTFLDSWYSQAVFVDLLTRPELRQQLIQEKKENDPEGLALSLEQMGTGVQPVLWGELSGIKNPLLLIVGSEDTKFGKINMEMAARCRTADLRVVKDAGHIVHQERPQDFANLVDDFLRQ